MSSAAMMILLPRWSRPALLCALLTLVPATGSAQSVTLAWDPTADEAVSGFTVHYGSASGSWSSARDVGMVNQFTISGLTRGSTYYFIVRAYSADGLVSPPSNEVFTTIPYIDATPSPTAPGLELLFQHTDGRLMSARYTGFTQAGLYQTLSVRQTDANWAVMALADFNRDGRRDILWQHRLTGYLAVWLMDGATMLDGRMLSPADPGSPEWKVAACGDFDGDGQPDLVLRHKTSGLLAAWFLDGTTLRDGQMLSPSNVADPGWHVKAAADFDGDHKTDLLWQHDNGTTAAWLMDGAILRDGASLTPAKNADTRWSLFGTAIANADGYADVVWRHTQTGAVAIWMMNGFNLVDGAMLTSLPFLESGWRLVASR